MEDVSNLLSIGIVGTSAINYLVAKDKGDSIKTSYFIALAEAEI